MTYRYVCEPCRRSLGLAAGSSYLNRIRREAGGFSSTGTATESQLVVIERDPTGKPLRLRTTLPDCYMITPAGCACVCSENEHDPMQCTGKSQFKIGGRPGSGTVDKLAAQLGNEPIPELILAPHETCEAMVGHFLAWWFGSTDDERKRLEAIDLARMKYEDQIKLLRDILQDERPDLVAEKPYCELIPNLRRLVRFRNKIAHSRPTHGDFFRRTKRVDGENVSIDVSREELAEYLDLATALESQLWFIPQYLDRT